MKKIIFLPCILFMLLSCDKQEYQAAEDQKFEDFKEKYELQSVQNNGGFAQFKTVEEAETFIKNLKKDKSILKEAILQRIGDQYFIKPQNIDLKGVRLKSKSNEDVYGSIHAGMFSSFRVDFRRKWAFGNFIIDPSSVVVSVTGAPILWSWNQNSVSMYENVTSRASFSVRGIISWGIGVGGQGLVYNEAARIQYNVNFINNTISGSITKE
ncbi:hypothetical protein [Sphingobacterium griseoflavum]|nr:hypothetical protein [Sphingobacterium griseoflavum]